MSQASVAMTKGERLASEGDLAGAKSSFEAAQKASPGDSRVMLRLASALHDQGDYTGALESATAATTADAEHAPSWALVAKYALLAGEPDVAIDAVESALKLAPDNAMAPTLGHLAKGMKGDLRGAILGLARDGVFEQSDTTALALELFLNRWWSEGPAHPPMPDIEIPRPDVGKGVESTGGAGCAVKGLHESYNGGDAIGMLTALADLAEDDPGHEDLASGYAAALHLCGRDDLAEPWIRRAMDEQKAAAKEDFAADRDRTLSRLGRAIMRRPEPSRPPEGFEPEAEGLILAGWIYLGLDQLKQARKYAARGSLTVNPFDRWEARLVIASIDLRQGRRTEALSELRSAIMEEPLVLYLWLHRAALLDVLHAMSRSITLACEAGDQALEVGLRLEMGRILTDPAKPKGARALGRVVSDTETDLPEADAALILDYCSTGLAAVCKETST